MHDQQRLKQRDPYERNILTGLGRQLRTLRRARGLTQMALAEQADIGWKHLGAIERGETNPTATLLGHIVRALGVEPYELWLFSVLDGDQETRLRLQLFHLVRGKTAKELQKALDVLKLVLE